jgi:hypothetical protein
VQVARVVAGRLGTIVRNAMTSWCTSASIAAMRAASSRARARTARRTPAGHVPACSRRDARQLDVQPHREPVRLAPHRGHLGRGSVDHGASRRSRARTTRWSAALAIEPQLEPVADRGAVDARWASST